ncbi:DNA polymerase IV [Maritalea mediterranea]|uniref:DNA polymerase IV n=1 Tax=Maritalea mediterranea TaxID=2909667 RepID=A0ABS9EAI5_9HYPH|nr:DNA polymerase IV [Maritalea mediterranea]MCF4099897.1 DNA polymerase IV [Maritalea mediterranea]
MNDELAPTICRDCGHLERALALTRCPNCRSIRLISHPELLTLDIAHVDCDSFYAAVEKRDNPDLLDKPLIVGGRERGVVSTCCYIARMSGVRSAMPIFQAKRLCPNAVFMPPNMAKYVEVSKQIKAKFLALTPLVEPLSIDEAFLDLSGTQLLHKASPVEILVRLANEVERDIGVTISIGLSHNKFLAKIASELDKPRGLALIGAAETRDFLAKQKVTVIYGIGKKFGQRLEKDGITHIGQLQQMGLKDLASRYGEIGARLFYLSQGEDKRKIKSTRGAKSVSNETTFFKDISDFDELSHILLKLSEKVSARLKKGNIAGDTVTLKLKTAGFATRTRSRQLIEPTQLAHVIFETGMSLLKKEVGMTAFRLLGIGVTGLATPTSNEDPHDLLDPNVARKAKAERAMDSIREKFGEDALLRGRMMRAKYEKEQRKKDSQKDNSDERH